MYDAPPLDGLARLDDAAVFGWLNREVPWNGSRVDWDGLAGHEHWSRIAALDLHVAIGAAIAELPGAVDHVGDSLSPIGVRIQPHELDEVLPALLAIPEHHYLLAGGRTWLAVVTFEGDLDFALLA